MLTEFRKSINYILYERVVSPFFGTLLISWIIWNWKIFYLTLFVSEDRIEINKIDFILNNYTNNWHLFYFPLISTIALITIVPFITNGAYWLSLKFQKWRLDKKNEIERSQLLTLEQSIQLRSQLQRSEDEFDKLIAREENVRKTLEAQIVLNNKNSNDLQIQIEAKDIAMEEQKREINSLEDKLHKAFGNNSSKELSDIFKGVWNSEFSVPAQNGKPGWKGTEKKIEFAKNNQYLIDSKHMFNLDMIEIDPEMKRVKFRKTSRDGGLSERITCDLEILGDGVIQGIEDNMSTGNNIKIVYKRAK